MSGGSRQGFSLLRWHNYKPRRNVMNKGPNQYIKWFLPYILEKDFWWTGYMWHDTWNDLKRKFGCRFIGHRIEYSKRYHEKMCTRCWKDEETLKYILKEIPI